MSGLLCLMLLVVSQYPSGVMEHLPLQIGEFVSCITGPGGEPSGWCAFSLDVDADGDIDLADFAWAQNIGPCLITPCRPGAGLCCSEGFFTDPP